MVDKMVYLILIMCTGAFLVGFMGRLVKAKIVGERPGGEVILRMAYMLYGWFVIEALNRLF